MAKIIVSTATFDSFKSSITQTQPLLNDSRFDAIKSFLPKATQTIANTTAQLDRFIGGNIGAHLPNTAHSEIGYTGKTRGLGLQFVVESKDESSNEVVMSLHITAKADDATNSAINRSKVVKRFTLSFDANENLLSTNSVDPQWSKVFANTAQQASETLNAQVWNACFNKLLYAVRAKPAGSGHVILDNKTDIDGTAYDNLELIKQWVMFAQECGQSDAAYVEAQEMTSPMANSLLSRIGSDLQALLDDAEAKLDPSNGGKLRTDSVSNALLSLGAFGDYLAEMEQSLEGASELIKQKLQSVADLRQQALDKWDELEAKVSNRTTPSRSKKQSVDYDKATHVRITKAGIAMYDSMLQIMGAELVQTQISSGQNMSLALLQALKNHGESEYSAELLQIDCFKQLVSKKHIELLDKTPVTIIENR